MNNQNTNPNPSLPPTSAPSISTQSDVPPMPDYMNVGATTANPANVTPPSNPTVSGPRKKFGGGKIIATILGLVVLLGGVGAGIFLTGQNQNINEKASVSNYTCPLTSGQSCSEDQCSTIGMVSGSGSCPSTLPYCCKPASSGVCQPGQEDTATCFTSDNRSGTKTRTCTENHTWGAYGSCVANFVCTPGEHDTGTCFTSDNRSGTRTRTCNSDGQGYGPWSVCTANFSACTNLGTGQHFGNGTINLTQSMIDSCVKMSCSGGTPYLYANRYHCSGINLTECNSDGINVSSSYNLTSPGTISIGSVSCGTDQLDIGCKNSNDTYGSVASTIKGGSSVCGNPTNPPSGTTASCTNIKAYDPSWTLIPNTSLSSLAVGSVVNFCVVGTTTGGSFDKARFTINGVLQAETTTQRPGSQDFCQSYTIPAGTTAFDVTAQLHHTTLEWIGP